jgi:hypothetical protein
MMIDGPQSLQSLRDALQGWAPLRRTSIVSLVL